MEEANSAIAALLEQIGGHVIYYDVYPVMLDFIAKRDAYGLAAPTKDHITASTTATGMLSPNDQWTDCMVDGWVLVSGWVLLDELCEPHDEGAWADCVGQYEEQD